MFSIIVPIYNMQDYLNQCIQSILNQTFEDFELLLINDGSTDDSLSICQSYHDPRIKLLTQANKGVSAARNLGLEQMTRKYVIFIDPDDYVDQNHLLNLAQALKTNQFSFLFNEFFFEKEGINTATHFGKSEKNQQIGLKKTFEYCSHGMGFLGVLFNKAFQTAPIKTAQLRFDEQIHQREDRLFCLDYLLTVKDENPDAQAIILDQPTYHYVSRKNSQMNQINAKTFSALLAQAQIEEKTDLLSDNIQRWNKNKRITENLYLHHYAMQHPEVYEQLSPKLLQMLKQNITRLLDFSVQTYAYLLITRTIDFKQKLRLIKIFHTIKKSNRN
ncbi:MULTISPECIES: glycosyltransferase family A protein [unclassified Lactococcus]|uniref:glycosyltransferase family 2 protein n=1 Tax=unclassified Lactococcus TaxID=2643510 RepID=UPI0011CCB8F3|nr:MULTISPECIES: glycosyltransferase family A protein [unclassified Lactococcus]MQW22023.1 glycosyltransferase [Lactococcus sp. dk101]TXK44966.1 glycosyltransferase family 2 protein [Lactococcus sp. dk310]TXK51253.1 glycosyltransferase family 2 protein [Lactococcus sp. dk322]